MWEFLEILGVLSILGAILTFIYLKFFKTSEDDQVTIDFIKITGEEIALATETMRQANLWREKFAKAGISEEKTEEAIARAINECGDFDASQNINSLNHMIYMSFFHEFMYAKKEHTYEELVKPTDNGAAYSYDSGSSAND